VKGWTGAWRIGAGRIDGEYAAKGDPYSLWVRELGSRAKTAEVEAKIASAVKETPSILDIIFSYHELRM